MSPTIHTSALISKIKTYGVIALVTLGTWVSVQHLVQAADQNVKNGNFVVTSSSATNNVTDLWVVEQSTRTVYLCRAGGGSGTAPTCTKGTQLP
ncbi:MAG: hypothetical protein V4568_15505 [Pseudomonadota bacterium]